MKHPFNGDRRRAMVQAIKGGTKLLRVGVVGVGVMGSNHARVLAELLAGPVAVS